MNFWKTLSFISGLLVITLIARQVHKKSSYQNESDKRYDNEDFLIDQDL